MENIKCPKCNSTNIFPRLSSGGPAIYKQLICKDCRFRGGHSRVYTGEEERVEKEIKERFINKENSPDAVRSTLASMGL